MPFEFIDRPQNNEESEQVHHEWEKLVNSVREQARINMGTDLSTLSFAQTALVLDDVASEDS